MILRFSHGITRKAYRAKSVTVSAAHDDCGSCCTATSARTGRRRSLVIAVDETDSTNTLASRRSVDGDGCVDVARPGIAELAVAVVSADRQTASPVGAIIPKWVDPASRPLLDDVLYRYAFTRDRHQTIKSMAAADDPPELGHAGHPERHDQKTHGTAPNQTGLLAGTQITRTACSPRAQAGRAALGTGDFAVIGTSTLMPLTASHRHRVRRRPGTHSLAPGFNGCPRRNRPHCSCHGLWGAWFGEMPMRWRRTSSRGELPPTVGKFIRRPEGAGRIKLREEVKAVWLGALARPSGQGALLEHFPLVRQAISPSTKTPPLIHCKEPETAGPAQSTPHQISGVCCNSQPVASCEPGFRLLDRPAAARRPPRP